jgi:hypothetical protein
MANAPIQSIVDALQPETSPPDYNEVVKKLREIADSMTKALSPAISVQAEPGHRVNLGDQYNFALLVRDPYPYRDVLFRAYVPADGFPVTLDLFEDQKPECRSLDELVDNVTKFLGHADVKRRLTALRDLAAATP